MVTKENHLPRYCDNAVGYPGACTQNSSRANHIKLGKLYFSILLTVTQHASFLYFFTVTFLGKQEFVNSG